MKVGVIGTGKMGENHVRVCSSLNDLCELVGVFDTDFIRASAIATKHNTKAYSRLEDLLENVDAVSIVVPTPFHYQIGLSCIQHGVHMLMEKPFTAEVAEGLDLSVRAQQAGLTLQVGHIELYNPTIIELGKIIQHQEIIAIDIHRLSPYDPRNVNVDVINDLMIHDIYILHELLKDEMVRFYSVGRIFDRTVKHAMVLAEFSKGVVAHLSASFKTEEKIRTIKVVTPKAFIQADLIDKKIIISRSTNFNMEKISETYTQENIIEKVNVPSKEPLRMEWIDFLDCIQKKRLPKVSGLDGVRALKIVNEISRSVHLHNHQMEEL
ncbi:Gfo/Idh/MocA family oxidoreductase [Paenibacillus sp. SYP-B3998]|uniref:Gfo/Idh/MocA family oxidoreductase n=1 Tax=Paenibacillus sp. SYP-B3998 TaxID=2678564 RepID=A0A6G3ZQV8_9BACL|nr:Gfo/Idh/MocA family oxidoreductase [Paenibacillus sp. SYP-B3998]NEW04430.1 Gfo/Idh/MocA family oxidoreductase [Paenibacillus sp. SYP-B3998]